MELVIVKEGFGIVLANIQSNKHKLEENNWGNLIQWLGVLVHFIAVVRDDTNLK